MDAVTMTRPIAASLRSRRLPRRNAVAIPTTLRLSGNVTSGASMNVRAAATIQYAAGAAKGNRRRAKSGSTRTAMADRENQSGVVGAPG
jgi:hypothetical protein